MTARLLILGIDAANPELVERWAADGRLPHLARLIHEGLSGRVAGLRGFYVGSTWPSFYTGLGPGHHGHHSLLQLRPGGYEYRAMAAAGVVQNEPFWAHLGRHGRRVAILDVPLTPLCPQLNGVQTVEWGAHDALYGFRAQPLALQTEISRRFGSHPLGPDCDAERRTAEDYRGFLRRLTKGAAVKAELTLHVLGLEPWDFAMQVFTEGHCAGHQCWHLHDRTHPAHDAGIAAALGDPLQHVYAAIDAAIGRILADARPRAVLVLSAHGMSWWFGAQFLLREILFRLGVTARPAETPVSTAAAMAARLGSAAPGWLRSVLRPLRNALAGRAEASAIPGLGVNAADSLCFPVYNGLAVGGIRLNLAGREPQGRLAAGRQADEFCAQLAADLLGIADAASGRPLIRAVHRTRDLYSGPRLDDLPDLLVEWDDGTAIGSARLAGGNAATVRATSPKIGLIEGTNRYARTGEHRPEGFFVAHGAGIGQGRLNRPVSVLDFAPTVCARLGVPLPPCEGEPIGELTAVV